MREFLERLQEKVGLDELELKNLLVCFLFGFIFFLAIDFYIKDTIHTIKSVKVELDKTIKVLEIDQKLFKYCVFQDKDIVEVESLKNSLKEIK